jgi:hypothetical protein
MSCEVLNVTQKISSLRKEIKFVSSNDKWGIFFTCEGRTYTDENQKTSDAKRFVGKKKKTRNVV